MQTVEIKRLKDGFFSDPKTGWSAYPFMYGFGADAPADLRGVHVVAILPGQMRGNHYHRDTNELLFVFSGSGDLVWKEAGRLCTHRIDGGNTVITIPAGVSHAFRNTGETPVYLVALRDGAFDPKNPDVVKSEII
jgi:mannose-6-phosphate isomerase-like protein (cupin superfamily)